MRPTRRSPPAAWRLPSTIWPATSEESGARRLRQDEAYRRLLADLSHDLRTPLTSIVGYVEALRTGASRDPSRHLEVVAARAAQLARLVEGLLLLSRLEAGDGVVRREAADLGEVVRRACEPFREALEQRAIRFTIEVPPQLVPGGGQRRRPHSARGAAPHLRTRLSGPLEPGLWLAIVRLLAQAHGGTADVTSDPSARRTTFRVRLPGERA